MQDLLIASSNVGKFKEFERVLSPHFKVLSPQDIASTPMPHVEETGLTYEQNALLKAQAFYQAYGTSCLSDDSGLEVEILAGAPGLYSARFGGEHLSWPDRLEKLIEACQKKSPQGPWKAKFVCVLCFIPQASVPLFFRGEVQGEIVSQGEGHEGFGYDPLFYYPPLQTTFGKMESAQKNGISHRAQALRALLDFKTNP